MHIKTAPYDVAEFLEMPEEMAAYLEACFEESDGARCPKGRLTLKWRGSFEPKEVWITFYHLLFREKPLA